MRKVYINKAECFSSIGFGQDYNWKAIQAQESGIKKIDQMGFISACYGGQIADAWIDEQMQLSIGEVSGFTRFERLLLTTLHPIVTQGTITAKTALVVSTTKGNIAALAGGKLEEADINRSAQRVADFFGFSTPPIVVCNACVSGILAVAVAKRLIQMEQFDEAYVVAGDELTPFVVSGFTSFQAMSKEPCTPFDLNRQGVSLGEATAAVYLNTIAVEGVSFEVIGEASIADANHISGPSRTGEGLFLSIQEALKEAQLTQDQIDCICAHGTATAYNDEMEAIAFDRLGLVQTPIHSQKGYFGHTLGAAGLLELVMLMQSMRNNELIVSKGFTQLGVSRTVNITTKKEVKSLQIGLKTASGFGGSNTAVILSKK